MILRSNICALSLFSLLILTQVNFVLNDSVDEQIGNKELNRLLHIVASIEKMAYILKKHKNSPESDQGTMQNIRLEMGSKFTEVIEFCKDASSKT